MKIGIITFHHVPNYGSVLQAYAFAKYLNTLNGVNAKIIDYRPFKATKAFVKYHLKSPIIIQNIIKVLKFNKFIKKNLPLSRGPITKNKNLLSLSYEYDAFVVGSDQVWINGKPRGYDEAYYLSFAPPNTAYAYSASFGSTKHINSSLRKNISFQLKKFTMISVRDLNSLKIVKQLTGYSPILTCDPTLLVDFNEFIMKPTKIKPYILLFGRFWWLPKEFFDALHNQGLTVICVGNYNYRSDASFYTADPGEWVNLVANSKAILTTYFHGTIFALKYNKPFISVAGGRSAKTLKIRSLLENFDLSERLFERGENIIEYLSYLFKKPGTIKSQYLVDMLICKSRNYLKKIVAQI